MTQSNKFSEFLKFLKFQVINRTEVFYDHFLKIVRCEMLGVLHETDMAPVLSLQKLKIEIILKM